MKCGKYKCSEEREGVFKYRELTSGRIHACYQKSLVGDYGGIFGALVPGEGWMWRRMSCVKILAEIHGLGSERLLRQARLFS
jgi:hypothetical protein